LRVSGLEERDAVNFGRPIYAPPATDDKMRLRQIDTALQRAREWERAEPARKAEEERKQREREAKPPDYTVEQLEVMRADLQARIIEQQTQLQCDREAELRRQRVARLSAEIEIGETRLADLKAQRDALMAKLARCSAPPSRRAGLPPTVARARRGAPELA